VTDGTVLKEDKEKWWVRKKQREGLCAGEIRIRITDIHYCWSPTPDTKLHRNPSSTVTDWTRGQVKRRLHAFISGILFKKCFKTGNYKLHRSRHKCPELGGSAVRNCKVHTVFKKFWSRKVVKVNVKFAIQQATKSQRGS